LERFAAQQFVGRFADRVKIDRLCSMAATSASLLSGIDWGHHSPRREVPVSEMKEATN
jgi:hypothetical protein